VKIRGAVLREPGKPYSIEEMELDPPKEKEALVRYVNTGFCHSDLSVQLGNINMVLPIVAGHEAAGIVEEVGPGCTRVKEGDHVVATFMVPCGKCEQCCRGMGNICTGSFVNFVNGMLLDGTDDADRRLRSMLHWDVNNGIARRAWARNDEAIFAITRAMETEPKLRVTLPNLVDPDLLEINNL